jgi:Zn-dependent peptidase ImmA (M78 family)
MSYRRGFKAHADRVAEEIRGELDLKASATLDVMELAEHLAIPVFGLKHLSNGREKQNFHRYFSVEDKDTFSAITIFRGFRRCIVHNDSHHPNRQASNIAHEVSHSLLEHTPTSLRGKDGERIWDADMEAEATWLGGVLLMPRSGALALFQAGMNSEQIAIQYGISEQLCRWRLQETGIIQQAIRARRYLRR